MQSCEDFEVRVEMRLHGALDVPEAAILAGHLSACTSCRAFEALAAGSENAMNQRARTQLQTLDWDELWSRTRSMIARQSRDQVLASAVVAVAITPAIMLIEGNVLQTGIGMLVLWSAAIGWRLLSARRKLAAIVGYQGDTGELLFFYRRELEDRLRSARAIVPIFAVCVAVVVRRLFVPFGSVQQWIGLTLQAAVMFGACAYVWFVRRPRIARELAALKADARR